MQNLNANLVKTIVRQVAHINNCIGPVMLDKLEVPLNLEAPAIYDSLVMEIGYPKDVKSSWDECVVMAQSPAVIAHFATAVAMNDYVEYLKTHS